MRLSIALMLGCLLGLSRAAAAQGPVPTTSWVRSWQPPTPPRQRLAVLPDTVRHIQPTHWKKGLVIGAAIGAVVAGVFTNGLCRTSDVSHDCMELTVGGALLTGALTGTIGALIGGAFPRRE